MTYDKTFIDNLLSGIGVGSFNKFETFLKKLYFLKGGLFWYAFGDAYSGSDNLFKFGNIIKILLLRDEPEREMLMSEEELAYLNSLPESITIYRGMSSDELDSKEFGISWTTEEKVAGFFAEKYQRNISTNHTKKIVHKITIDKKEVIAFLNEREEFEVLYLSPEQILKYKPLVPSELNLEVINSLLYSRTKVMRPKYFYFFTSKEKVTEISFLGLLSNESGHIILYSPFKVFNPESHRSMLLCDYMAHYHLLVDKVIFIEIKSKGIRGQIEHTIIDGKSDLIKWTIHQKKIGRSYINYIGERIVDVETVKNFDSPFKATIEEG